MKNIPLQEIIALLFILTIVFFVIFGAFAYQKRIANQWKAADLRQATFQQEILQAQIEIQDQTLKNINQEIHDNIGQVLSLVKINLNTFPLYEDDWVNGKMQDTKQLISKAIVDMRDLSRSMHGNLVAELGFKNAIEHELNIIGNTGHFTVSLLIAGDHYKLARNIELILFRIVQEALNNSVKHSKTKNIEVKLQYEPTRFSISIKDEGIGFDVAAVDQLPAFRGLSRMKSRTALISGFYLLNSSPGQGTTITVEIIDPIAYQLNRQ